VHGLQHQCTTGALLTAPVHHTHCVLVLFTSIQMGLRPLIISNVQMGLSSFSRDPYAARSYTTDSCFCRSRGDLHSQ
jgi:hypothetical protein